jgi:hypothetical protein
MSIETLQRIAGKILDQVNNDPARALPHFFKAVQNRPDHIEALALYFLQREAMMGGRIKVKAHTVPQHRRRTPEQKAAARHAMAATLGIYQTRRIGDRLVAKIAMGEVRSMVRERVQMSAVYMRHGLDELVNSLLLHKILAHAQADDMRALVSDVVPEKIFERFDREAFHEAVDLMPKLMQEHTANAIKQIESVA